jgi:transposase
LDVVPAQFRVIVTRRPKYACRACTDGVVQAPAPARLIQAGPPTEATVAHVLVSKYADHLPLYRMRCSETTAGPAAMGPAADIVNSWRGWKVDLAARYRESSDARPGRACISLMALCSLTAVRNFGTSVG